jgi:hypothetical protein
MRSAFRLRNLAMHLLAVRCRVRDRVHLLGRSRAAAAGAALLFGSSPLANEAVVVAIWTNTTAYALAAGLVFPFSAGAGCARRGGQAGRRAARLARALGDLALFTYEPTIVVFGMMLAYLALSLSRPGADLARVRCVAFAAGRARPRSSSSACGTCSGSHGRRPAAGRADRCATWSNISSRSCLPVDLVLRQRAVRRSAARVRSTRAAFDVRLAARLYARRAPDRVRLCRHGAVRLRLARMADWRDAWVLARFDPARRSCRSCSSERTSRSSTCTCRPRCMRSLVALVLAHSAATGGVRRRVGLLIAFVRSWATWVRNGASFACAREVATKIVASLPIAPGAQGEVARRLATPPGDQRLTPRYGIYNYSGIETLEVTEYDDQGRTGSRALATGNDRSTSTSCRPQALRTAAPRPTPVFTFRRRRREGAKVRER